MMDTLKKVENFLSKGATVLGVFIFRFLRGFARTVKKLAKNPKGRIGLCIAGALVLTAIIMGMIDPDTALVKPSSERLLGPSTAHWFGTDSAGKDILFQILHGTRVSLMVGILTALGVTLLGSTLGIIAGYFGGWVDILIMRGVDVLLVIPSLPLMLMLGAMFEPYRFYHLIIIFIILGWAGTARTIRAVVLSLKESNFIKAAELAGANRAYTMFKHILPGVSHLLIMSTAMSSAGFMVAEAGLSFVGLSDPYAVSWGKLIADAQGGFSQGAWWAILFPGLALIITVFGFMQIGLALEGIWNPRMGSSEKTYKLFKRLNPNYVNDVFLSMDTEGDVTPNNPLIEAPKSKRRG